MSYIVSLSSVSHALKDLEGLLKLKCSSESGHLGFQPSLLQEKVVRHAGANFCLTAFISTLPKCSGAPEKLSCQVRFLCISIVHALGLLHYFSFSIVTFAVLLPAHFITSVLINSSNLATINLSILKSLWILLICS